MATDITTIKNWFKTGLKPTQAQFWSWIDSYWHKDEKLPISNIENLENVLNSKASDNHSHSEYATNDATSLTDENTLEWQKKLKIDDLKFDDKSITVTQDYSDFGLQAGATINSFNNEIYQTVRNKLDAPVEEGTTTDYPYVVGVNEDNESVKLPAGDLGKNFANTDLVVSSARKHTGTASVEFGMPLVFSNASQKFSALPDKSADATYSEILGGDSNGNLAKIGSQAIVSKLQKSSQTEINTLFSLLNGAYVGASAIKVNAIYPLFLTKNNNSQSITLLGTGLNIVIDGLITKVRLIDLNDLTKLPIDLSYNPISANELKVILDPNSIEIGHDYKIEIISGTQRHVTTPFISVLDEENIVNVVDIDWKHKNLNNKDAILIDSDVIRIPSQGITSTSNTILQEVTATPFESNTDFVFSFTLEQSDYSINSKSIPIVGVRDSSLTELLRTAYTNYIGVFQYYNGVRNLYSSKTCFSNPTTSAAQTVTVVISKRGDTYSYSDTDGTILTKTTSLLNIPKLFIGYYASSTEVVVSIKSLQYIKK